MTELHDITVHYEREDLSIVEETHTAARERWWHEESGTTLCIDTGLCACCDAVEETHEYNHDRVVKVEYEPSDHEREERDSDISPSGLFITVVFTVVVIAAIVLFVLTSPGGTL